MSILGKAIYLSLLTVAVAHWVSVTLLGLYLLFNIYCLLCQGENTVTFYPSICYTKVEYTSFKIQTRSQYPIYVLKYKAYHKNTCKLFLSTLIYSKIAVSDKPSVTFFNLLFQDIPFISIIITDRNHKMSSLSVFVSLNFKAWH